MANEFQSNETFDQDDQCALIKCNMVIYHSLTHPPIYLVSYLFTYYPPTNYLPTYLPIYLFFHFHTTYILPTYYPH